MKLKNLATKQLKLSQLSLVIISLISSQTLSANPIGPEVISGQVSIDSSIPGTMNITNTPGTIINWQNFSIAQGEITRFIQQNSQSAVLNRVIGQNPSQIMGQLISNGQVYLINPNGIVFGLGSSVSTQAFMASTLALSDQDFLTGNYHFIAGSETGSIFNEGVIRTGADGNIILIAPNIENSGIIESDGGKITLAAGQELTLTSLDEPQIRYQVQAPANEVLNLGQILSNGGAIDLFSGTLIHSGDIRSDSLTLDASGNITIKAQSDITLTSTSSISSNATNQSGNILIESETGTTLVSGSISSTSTTNQGGDIHILGEYVGLIDQAIIDATGQSGGEVLVGGDYQGTNLDIKNAHATYVGQDVTIKANATSNGDGGKVIVWADDSTRMYGSIEAKAGSVLGDGGFVEVSGKQGLDYRGDIDVSSANGIGGSILFDPKNITITDAGGDALVPDGSGFIRFTDLGDSYSAIFSTSDIETYFNAGSSLTLQAHNDITINDQLDLNGYLGNNFTLYAGRSILINADININDGRFFAYADSALANSTYRDVGAASITLTGATISSTSPPSAVPIKLSSPTINLLSSSQINIAGSASNYPDLYTENLTIDASSSITAPGVAIRPYTGSSVGIGGETGDLQLTEATLNRINPTTSGITIQGNSGGDVRIGALSSPSTNYYIYSYEDMYVTGTVDVNYLKLYVDVDNNGTNTMDLSSSNISSVTTMRLDGGTDNNDRLLLPNTGNQITLANDIDAGNPMQIYIGGVSGTLSNVYEFGSVIGGSGVDTFIMSYGTFTPQFSGTLDGGAGNDILSYANNTTGISFNFASSTATNLGGFANIESFIGGSDDDSFVMGNVDTIIWSLDGGSGGFDIIDFSSRTSTNPINFTTATFTNIGQIDGGTLDDKYIFNNSNTLSFGTLNDDSGANTLTIDSGTVTITDILSTSNIDLVQNGGTLNFTYAGTTTLTNFSMSGGNFSSGVNNVDITGIFNWSGGSLQSSGLLDLSAATVNLSGTPTIDGMTLDLGGPLTISSGTLSILSGGLTVTDLTVQNGAGFSISGGTLASSTLQLNGSTSFAGGTIGATTSTTFGSTAVVDINASTTITSPSVINQGLLKLNSGNLTLSNFTQTSGETRLNGGNLISAVQLNGGSLTGSGTVIGNVVNNGTISPGFSPGLISITGDFTQGPSGLLYMEIAGTTLGSYDRLFITGSANLGGTLNIVPIAPYSTSAVIGDQFNLITAGTMFGDFATHTTSSGFVFATDYFGAIYTATTSAFPVTSPTLSTVNTIVDIQGADVISLNEQALLNKSLEPTTEEENPYDNTDIASVTGTEEVEGALMICY